jgi:hypothetical protein
MLDERCSVPARHDRNVEATVLPGANAIGRAFDVFEIDADVSRMSEQKANISIVESAPFFWKRH